MAQPERDAEVTILGSADKSFSHCESVNLVVAAEKTFVVVVHTPAQPSGEKLAGDLVAVRVARDRAEIGVSAENSKCGASRVKGAATSVWTCGAWASPAWRRGLKNNRAPRQWRARARDFHEARKHISSSINCNWTACFGMSVAQDDSGAAFSLHQVCKSGGSGLCQSSSSSKRSRAECSACRGRRSLRCEFFGPAGFDEAQIELFVRPVNLVADQRVTEMREMHADLMGAAGLRQRADHRELRSPCLTNRSSTRNSVTAGSPSG